MLRARQRRLHRDVAFGPRAPVTSTPNGVNDQFAHAQMSPYMDTLAFSTVVAACAAVSRAAVIEDGRRGWTTVTSTAGLAQNEVFSNGVVITRL